MSKKCFWCREPVDRVALVDLVYTWEPFHNDLEDNSVDELKEIPWHKACYAQALKSAIQESFQEAVAKDADMTPEQKAYWLSQSAPNTASTGQRHAALNRRNPNNYQGWRNAAAGNASRWVDLIAREGVLCQNYLRVAR